MYYHHYSTKILYNLTQCVVWQWMSIVLVFSGLYLQIAAKLFVRHHGDEDVGGGESSVGKKKIE